MLKQVGNQELGCGKVFELYLGVCTLLEYVQRDPHWISVVAVRTPRCSLCGLDACIFLRFWTKSNDERNYAAPGC